MEQNENKLILSFTDTESGLLVKDNASLEGFAIANNDGKFVWRNATIKRDKIVVWNDTISNTSKVRYAWVDNPVEANFYNKENLPASPFESDLNKKK